jgi:exopolysaccharide biosynthesis polyprenyl glycosylphosphotransferase
MIDYRTRGTAKLGIACECLLVSLAFWLWLAASQRRWELSGLDLQRYVVYNVVLIAGIVLAYATAVSKGWFTQLAFSAAHHKAIRQAAFAVGLLLLLLIGKQDKTISRVFLFTFLPILYGILVLAHRVLPPMLQQLSFGGVRTQRVLIAGSSRNTSSLQGWLRSKERLGYSIAGMISHDGRVGTVNGLDIMGTLEDLEPVIVDHDITQVILVEFPEFRNFVSHYTDVCERRGVRLLIVCDFERALNHPVTMFEDDGVRFIGLREEPLEDPFGRFGKRCLDVAVALPAVLFVLPITTVVVAIIQWRYSPGPIFFRQLRTGLQNLPFAIYKYRTMHVANENPSRQAVKGDSRVFPGGEWLRKLSIDEVPQFINVLLGDMSVVGPRPHLMEHDELFARALSNYPVRGSVKPGITGLAQVRGFRGETKTPEDVIRRVESDIYYLENWSFFMDCWIILRTATQVIRPPATAF